MRRLGFSAAGAISAASCATPTGTAASSSAGSSRLGTSACSSPKSASGASSVGRSSSITGASASEPRSKLIGSSSMSNAASGAESLRVSASSCSVAANVSPSAGSSWPSVGSSWPKAGSSSASEAAAVFRRHGRCTVRRQSAGWSALRNRRPAARRAANQASGCPPNLPKRRQTGSGRCPRREPCAVRPGRPPPGFAAPGVPGRIGQRFGQHVFRVAQRAPHHVGRLGRARHGDMFGAFGARRKHRHMGLRTLRWDLSSLAPRLGCCLRLA